MAKTLVTDWDAVPILLTMEEARRVLGVSREFCYRLAHTPGFPLVRLGRAFRVPKQGLQAWITAQADGQEEDHNHAG